MRSGFVLKVALELLIWTKQSRFYKNFKIINFSATAHRIKFRCFLLEIYHVKTWKHHVFLFVLSIENL